MLFSTYYLVYVAEGDEVVRFIRGPLIGLSLTRSHPQLRRFRALCTVEMLRVTWEKTHNPYVCDPDDYGHLLNLVQIRLATFFQRPSVPVVRTVSIPRPSSSSRSHLPPVNAILYYNGTEEELSKATQLVVDFPGGGFVAMGPECHEERLRRWAKRTGKPVLGVNYGKAPECK